ncbi:hypothetical protein DFQ27_009455 [Actinomortierella ambigua]|uniref:Uncharacterized protein n=1 Tax=Actinomortierella ambigua TaxID=1343610 RepID=A0A9P6TX26_9FUNG|nr:hypothetical protein DFQ27_009455 [Actinomortierella ambigua]
MALFLGRLTPDTRSRDLEDIFAKYGRITRLDIKRGTNSDYGFVEYEDPRDADEAVHKLNGHTVNGSPIVVEYAKNNGRRAGDNECFKCGREGHWARDCREGRRRSPDRDRRRSRSPRRRYSRSRSRSRSPRRDYRNRREDRDYRRDRRDSRDDRERRDDRRDDRDRRGDNREDRDNATNATNNNRERSRRDSRDDREEDRGRRDSRDDRRGSRQEERDASPAHGGARSPSPAAAAHEDIAEDRQRSPSPNQERGRSNSPEGF